MAVIAPAGTRQKRKTRPPARPASPAATRYAVPALDKGLDVLMTAFGPDRLIWGSNWPVISLHGPNPTDLSSGFAEQIRIAEEYLAPLGEAVRDKVMFRNALLFYRRHVPSAHGND